MGLEVESADVPAFTTLELNPVEADFWAESWPLNVLAELTEEVTAAELLAPPPPAPPDVSLVDRWLAAAPPANEVAAYWLLGS